MFGPKIQKFKKIISVMVLKRFPIGKCLLRRKQEEENVMIFVFRRSFTSSKEEVLDLKVARQVCVFNFFFS